MKVFFLMNSISSKSESLKKNRKKKKKKKENEVPAKLPKTFSPIQL